MTRGAVFMKDVKELKAWQLYAGQSIWFFFVGIMFYIVKMLLDMTFLTKNKTFTSAYEVVESIGTGEAGAAEGSKFAAGVFGKDHRAPMDPIAAGMY